MPNLAMLVDYANVHPGLTKAGAVNLARAFTRIVPKFVLEKHEEITVRLYSGWRCQGLPTHGAQQLIAQIQAESPSVFQVNSGAGKSKNLRLSVELADGPIRSGILLNETLARERGIRKFRTRSLTSSQCLDARNCGLGKFQNVSDATPCLNQGCSLKLVDLFVHDEQKMVDTLIVADIAHLAFVGSANYVVLVSSDIDMWPGVLLALAKGCSVVHIHPAEGWKTQRHLLQTLNQNLPGKYQQFSI